MSTNIQSATGRDSVDDLLLAVSLIDLTTLEATDTPERVRMMCARAVRPVPDEEQLIGRRVPHVAAVCVWPTLVGAACEALKNSRGRDAHPVRVASVAGGFPSGQTPTEVKVLEARLAVEAGADEIDLVINRGAVLAGRVGAVTEEVREVRAACPKTMLKVILETGELEGAGLVRAACDAAIAGGADFLKTSTGKIAVGATPESVRVLLEAARDEFARSGRVIIGVKASGGIRTGEQALAYMTLAREVLGADAARWLRPGGFRFGASSLLDDLIARLRGSTTSTAKTGTY
ncbi:MAG: deoxyribose-phosphate aldolase [Phycisphaerales bacterium]